MLFSYAVLLGNDLTKQWLSSAIYCLFIGLLVLEPLKVLLITLIASLFCKDIDMDDDGVDEDEERATIAEESEW